MRVFAHNKGVKSMPQYFDNDPALASAKKLVFYRINDIDFALYTDNGVFSKEGLDYGSRALINTVIKEGFTGPVLDLGCGWGAIGVTLARLYPEINFELVDINERALELAKINAEKYELTNLSIYSSDGASAVKGKMKTILTNPPIRAGKEVVYRFFTESYSVLEEQGTLFVVIRKAQGAPSAVKKLTEIFGNCAIIEKNKGYFILKSIKK